MAHGGGQVPVSCSLCEESTRIEWKCLNCDMLMCNKCKEKIHVKFKFAKDHKVVSIEEVGLHAEEVDFSSISCQNHLKQNCFMFCKSCDCLVCPLCISETHNGHGLVAIKEGYEIHTNKLKTGQKNIKTKIDELKKRKAEVKDIESSEHSRLENTLKKIETQKNVLKNEVDQHGEKLKSEIMKRWEALHLTTKKEENEVTLLIGSLESQNSEVDDIILSNDGKRVFVDGLGLVQSMKETVTPPNTKFDSIPIFLPGQITSYNIGSLENVSIKGDIKIIKQIDTEISSINYIAACSEDTLWICDANILQKVKIEGCRLKVIHQKEVSIYGHDGMACTQSKDLLFISGGSLLKQISGQTGEVTDSIYDVKQGLTLSAVHINPDGKVTVGAYSGELVYPAVRRQVVIVMDKDGKHETTYEYDRHGKPIFTYVVKITRTKNGNICVVDHLSEVDRSRVVILSEDGHVLNTFSGHPEVNTDKKPFKPYCAFTTHSDNIIVTGLCTFSIFYILNSSGNLIRWVHMNKFGIPMPFSFSVGDSGHIFIGCTTATGSSDKAKIYELNIS